jgi:CRP-like cAMP-binding protein
MSEEISVKIDKFFSKYPKRSYPKGQLIIFGNENPEHIYYIAKGKVRSYDISYRGDEVIVNIFHPPAFFPMSWAINKTDNKYFYKTESESVLHTVPAEDALEFLKANPDVMLDLLSRLYKGIDGLLGRIVHLMSGTAKSRLVYELIIECRRFGKPIDKKDQYLLEVKESDLAARSGLSRETISREMKSLKSEKLVSFTKEGLVVEDLPSLESKLGTEI